MLAAAPLSCANAHGVRAAAETRELLVPQNLQQLGLELRRHLTDFVEQYGPLVAQLELARFGIGPVNVPRSYPKSPLSSKSAGTAAQFTFRNVRPDRGEYLWIIFPMTSFPTPLSPRIRTGISSWATSFACEWTLRIDALLQTKKVVT